MKTIENGVIPTENTSRNMFGSAAPSTPSLLEEMLGRILEEVKMGRTIREQTLLDLSKLVLRSIRESEKELPETFSWLFERISNYWHYELDSEENMERAYSYIRLYQTIGILQIAYRDQKRQEKIRDEAQKNEKLFPLLSMVNKKPGIRQKELEDLPEVSSETLHEDLESMERKGYLLGKGLGRNRSYILSIEGAELYEMYEFLIVNRFYDA